MTAFDGLLPRPVRASPAPGVSTVDSWRTRVVIDPAEVRHAEGYRITITPDGVRAIAADESGVRHAEQTLRQLAGPNAFRAANIHSGQWHLPCGEIEDHPRFAWRGCLLDVARHFQPKAAVLRFVDLLAAHKLNVLHLHLTDDQGWRVEVPGYPRLTEVGAWRAGSWVGRPPDGTTSHDGRPHGGYYTTDDLREIVAYARSRSVTVVPEVDIPGHSQAAIAAYPLLGACGPAEVRTAWGISEHVLNTAPSTVDFYRRVFDHLADVFDSPVICLGGDEAGRHNWPIGWIAEHLSTLGRRALGWDEILETGPLPPDTIIACWRSEEAAITTRHDVIMCPEQSVYLDHRQSDHPDEPIPVGYLVTLRDVYSYEPIPPGMPDPARVLGAQAQVWTEHLDNPRRVDYAAFPRLSAFAEVVWSPPDKDYTEFENRLATHHLPRLDALGVEYRPLHGPHPWQTRPGVPGRPR
ncbi:hexosaminidase [Herbihabitans rhizosphaerae]|uniref:beta-N-acetylhexosaminidase n=1 Tax=Herbihabitans rhizosphaerae TaxID=1872711 RepID=A0A4V2EU71_9PSEU|nr:beta-N-acetylhexosaminidase [Herbihabitans rhizosphaerae]RZS43553.1 hexosaminidase [Herbihabitans rhizosphaerae]